MSRESRVQRTLETEVGVGSSLMAAATVGSFLGTRARLVGARVESAELRMETIGLHA